MPTDAKDSRLAVHDLVSRSHREMIPVTNRFSYFSATPLVEEEIRHYLQDPIAALPPTIASALPPVGLVLVPFLEKASKGEEYVVFERPPEQRQVFEARHDCEGSLTLVLATKDEEVADYHYTFYSCLAAIFGETWGGEARDRYYRLLREELKAEVHGEVDERSWHQKQGLLRRQSNIRKETKLFRDYARQSFEDTLTLFLHGICCDIDVETGPRQLPSRYLRNRLELLEALYPPPKGYAVFPDHARHR
jgi:hypothetical protein